MSEKQNGSEAKPTGSSGDLDEKLGKELDNFPDEDLRKFWEEKLKDHPADAGEANESQTDLPEEEDSSPEEGFENEASSADKDLFGEAASGSRKGTNSGSRKGTKKKKGKKASGKDKAGEPEEEDTPEKKEKKHRVAILLNVLIFLMVCVLCFSAYQLVRIFQRYRNNSLTQEKVSDIFYAQGTTSAEIIQTDSGDSSSAEVEENTYTESYSLSPLVEQNPDTVGWIKMPDTVIDYAVMQGETNDDYIYSDFFKNYNFAGIPFLDCDNVVGAPLQNYIIYGHRMGDHSMFWVLGEFRNQSFYENHKTFTLLMREGDYDILYECQIFSAYHVSTRIDVWKTSFDSEWAYQQYINDALARSEITTDVSVSSEDKIVTLSTCDKTGGDETGRILVHAKMVPKVKTKVEQLTDSDASTSSGDSQ